MIDSKDRLAVKEFSRLIEILRRLRAPGGCDWDREQTAESLLPYLLEECYEVIEAVDNGDKELLKEELGDLLLHIVFQAEIAFDERSFHISDSIRDICDKLIRRHPHIFDKKTDSGSKEDWKEGSWERTKQIEKNRESVLDGIPRGLPALARASRLQEKAAGVGFDWDDRAQVIDKVLEEFGELRDAIGSGKSIDIESEMGDLLFSMVNLSRHVGFNPEDALRKSSSKFYRRFTELERYVTGGGKSVEELSLDELESIWDRVKSNERNR